MKCRMREVCSGVHGGKIEIARRRTCTSGNGEASVDHGIEGVGAVRENSDANKDEQQEEAEQSRGG